MSLWNMPGTLDFCSPGISVGHLNRRMQLLSNNQNTSSNLIWCGRQNPYMSTTARSSLLLILQYLNQLLSNYLIRERDKAEVYSHALAVAVESDHRNQVRLVHRNEAVTEQLAVSSVPDLKTCQQVERTKIRLVAYGSARQTGCGRTGRRPARALADYIMTKVPIYV